MPTTTPLRQMFDHVLEPIKGWFDENALDKVAVLSSNVTFSPVYKGRVAHLNSVGQFEMGATGHQVPIILAQNSDDADVARNADAVHAIYDASGGVDGLPIMSGWAMNGDFEIETAEFDTTQSYAYNDPVRAVASNTVAATGGTLTNAGVTLGTNCVCGWVSLPAYLNENNINVLRIWTAFIWGSGA
jgi:hypothetical protein